MSFNFKLESPLKQKSPSNWRAFIRYI
jgi:hypothetical protein